MKWYGCVVLFAATMVFCNFLYTVRLDYAGKDAVVAQDFPLPEDALPVWNGAAGERLTAQSLPDEPALLFFFASWCRPCLAELPVIAGLAKRGDVPFVGIAVRDKPERLEKLFKKSAPPYRVVGLDDNNVWSQKTGAARLPTAFVLNAKHDVVAKINGVMTEELYMRAILPLLRSLKDEKAL